MGNEVENSLRLVSDRDAATQYASSVESNMPAEGKDTPQTGQPGWFAS